MDANGRVPVVSLNDPVVPKNQNTLKERGRKTREREREGREREEREREREVERERSRRTLQATLLVVEHQFYGCL